MKSSLLARRPAETISAGAGTAGIVTAIALGDWLAAGLAAISYLPACVSYLYDNGGLAGIVRGLWRGRS